MSIYINNVVKGSPADKAGIKARSRLVSIDGFPMNDVLDFMFYGDEGMGLEFDRVLMDDKRHCCNNCVFCFIDQLPPRSQVKLRDTLYFKDDDSRLSFLQGTYITLTNLTEHDVERIIQMRTPVNVSVHTTNPDLRAKLMRTPKAAQSLDTLKRFAQAGITLNCQLVLCPGINDGAELARSLRDLTAHESVESIACVPVGLTKHREGLTALRRFTPTEAAAVIDATGAYDNVYAADELYLCAGVPLPEYEHYGTFPQYENGVGMCAYMKRTFLQAAANPRKSDAQQTCRTIVTGTAAYPLIHALVAEYNHVNVIAVRNNFFGNSVNVSGLLTGGDIIAQLTGRADIGERLLIGANTLNADGLFLDDLTPQDIEAALNVTVQIVDADGAALFEAVTL